MTGTANPVDLITGLATTANVAKADISAWAKARVAQVLANASEVRSTNLAAQLMVTLNSTGALLFLDAADHTTIDDGINCIVSADGGRYKPKTALLPPTSVSLGGVFSSSAAAHNFANGIDLTGALTYARPALADLSDGLSMDTDGTLSANSDTHIASQKAVKTYVDTVAQGLDPKQSVLVATTANITLSGEQTIDGVLTSASRVLVKNQTAPAQNGIYVSASGAWARSLDADTWAELPGAYTFVEQGTINGDCGFTCTVNAGGTLGTTAVTFVQFAGAGTYTAGSGVTLTGTQFSVGNNQITNAMRATMATYTIKGNNSGSTGNEGDIDITALTLKASPVSADVVLIQDSAASFAFKKTTVSALASAGSVSSIAGNTGAFTLSGLLTNSTNVLQVVAAVKSDQQTGTSLTLAVTPDHQQDHDSAIKAHCFCTVSGGVVTIQEAYNVTSVTRSATGKYVVNFTTGFATANFAAKGDATGGTGTVFSVNTISRTTGSASLEITQATAFALTDPTSLSFFASGRQ